MALTVLLDRLEVERLVVFAAAKQQNRATVSQTVKGTENAERAYEKTWSQSPGPCGTAPPPSTTNLYSGTV